MANEADDSSSKLVEQAAPSAQFPPLQRNLDQLEALSEKLKSKTLRTEAPSQSIAATRLLAREGLNAEQLARDLKSFELKLNEWITTGGMVSAETAAAEECEKMLRMGDRIGRIAYDKKKLLLHAILSSSRRQIDRLLRELPTLFNTIEDFLWFKLCAVRDQPGRSSFVLNDGSSPYTLSDLQAYLNKFEPSYYTKNGKVPLVYPYVLLLSIQLLPAILYMYKDTGNEAYNIDAVHISIALGDHGILAEGFGAGQTLGVMDAFAEASSLIRQYGALYLQHDDLSMALEYYAQAAGTMGGGQLSWTGRGNVHQQWQRTSMLKQLLLELLLRDGGIYLLLGSGGAGEEGELGRFLTDGNSRQQFLLEAARLCQEAVLYEKSIEIQKRVGAFSAALDTINKCLSEAIGALSRGRLDGESRTAGLIHSGNELVESFKYYPEVRKDTCKACWKDEMGMAEIVSIKGRLLTTIGIVRDGKIYCSIEETLYMAEVGALHLLHDDICLSLGEIYKMLSQGRYGCCWESFVVYKHLKSLGYIVSRHGVPWTLSHLTKNDSMLNEATTKTNLKSDSEYEDTVITIKLFKSMHIDKVKPVFDVYAHNSKFRKSSPGNPNFVLCLTSSLPPSKQEISDLERRCSGIPLKLCNVEHGRPTFFSFNTVELPILP